MVSTDQRKEAVVRPSFELFPHLEVLQGDPHQECYLKITKLNNYTELTSLNSMLRAIKS